MSADLRRLLSIRVARLLRVPLELADESENALLMPKAAKSADETTFANLKNYTGVRP
jgi:hypothetical protein